MSLVRPALLPAVALAFAACEPEPITDLESALIYSRMVDQVSAELTGAAEGPVSSTVPCPVGGSVTIEGTVVGTSVDRGWDVTTTASGCGIGGYDADGTEAGLTINSGGVAVFMPQPDDTTPFSASGSVTWERTVGFGSGTCTIATEAGRQ
jgi:hypothetical protein